MLTQVQVVNSAGIVLPLVLGNADNGFIVENITGLSPVKATMVSTTFADAPGAQYQTSRRETRNIVYTIGFRPGSIGSVSALRQKLYSYFMPQSEIVQMFYTDHLSETVKITGIVESFDMPQFSSTPEATISVICYDPDFLALSPVSSTFTVGGTGTTVNYNGTVNTGLEMKLNLATTTGVANTVTLTNTRSDGVQKLNFVHYASLPTGAGSYLLIDTNRFKKAVTMQSGSVVSSALAYVQPFSDWVQLKPGANKLAITFALSGTVATYTYTNRYGGI